MVDQVRVVIRSLNGFTERVVTRLALNINANLIEDTPVDTGWAQANWVPNVGGAFSGTAGTRSAAELGNLDEATQAKGIAEILGYRLAQGAIHDTNNVPYITLLNEGSSRKAPAAFVQAAIFRGIRQTLIEAA